MTSERNQQRYEHPLSSPREKTTWKPEEPFIESSINNALGVISKGVSSKEYGTGYMWQVTSRGMITSLEIYPSRNTLFLGTDTGGPDGYRTSAYRIDRLTVLPQAIEALHIGPERLHSYLLSVVCVNSQGETFQTHTSVPLNSMQRFPTENEIRKAAAGSLKTRITVSVEEAARMIGCDPANVRQLARRGRLPSRKDGAVWAIDAAAAVNYNRSNRGRPRSQPIKV